MGRIIFALAAFVCVLSLSLVAASTEPYANSAVRTVNPNPRTLVLIDSVDIKQSHSAFFQQLKSRGHELQFVVAGEEAIKLQKYNTYNYDNLVLFAPSADDLGDGLTVETIQSFVDTGRSLLIAVNEKVSEAMREIVSEFGIDIDEADTKVQDHAQYDASDINGHHDLVLAQLNPKAANIVGGEGKIKAPVLFRGIGHIAAESEWLHPVLTGSGTAFSYALGKTVSEAPAASGRDLLLVSALQTPTNARVVVSGSLDLFSNDLIHHSVFEASHARKLGQSGNEAFAREISMWAFQERGLLRARDLTHFKVDAEHDVNPQSYRVSDEVSFQITLEEYDGVSDSWKPFTKNDVQLEFTMLDPYLRVNLVPSANGKYSALFQVPDVYGVYKFVINYQRLGASNLLVSQVVSVHPFKHNEFERFIPTAFPYYASAFSMMAAFFIFGLVFLYHKE